MLAAAGAWSGKTNTGKAAATAPHTPDMGTRPSRLPGSLVLRRHGKKWCVPGISEPGTGPSLQEPQAGRSAKDFDICWSTVPREMKHLPRVGCGHPPGSTGGGQGGERGIPEGWFLKTLN